MSLRTFTIPPLPPTPPSPPPLNPSTTTYMRASPRWCQRSTRPQLPTVPKKAAKQKAAHPQNHLRAANVPTAFLIAAAGTERPDDANRSIGQTCCFGTTGNGPYGAEHIVACSHIVISSSLLRDVDVIVILTVNTRFAWPAHASRGLVEPFFQCAVVSVLVLAGNRFWLYILLCTYVRGLVKIF